MKVPYVGYTGGFKARGGRIPPELGHNKFQERLSGVSRIRQNLLAAGALPRTPLESLQRSTDPLAGGEWAGCPSTRTPPRSRLLGLAPDPK